MVGACSRSHPPGILKCKWPHSENPVSQDLRNGVGVIGLDSASSNGLERISIEVQRMISRSIVEKPRTWKVAIATIAPMAVAVFAFPITVIVSSEFHLDTSPILVGWCVVLIGLAAWLNQALVRQVRTLLPFLTAIGVILFIWLWQRQASTSLVPKTGLTWGYFLTPEGAKARFWVLVCPFWVGVTCLSLCCVVAVVSWWRRGARRSLAYMIPWWLAAFVIFAIPLVYLDGQGNASIFI